MYYKLSKNLLCILLPVLLLGACQNIPSSPPPKTVAPPALNVRGTADATEGVKVAAAKASMEVSALRTSVVEARRDAAALSDTVKKVLSAGAAAESKLAQELGQQAQTLTERLAQSEERAELAEEAHSEAAISLKILSDEVSSLQVRAGAHEQALAQYEKESAVLREGNDLLLKDLHKTLAAFNQEKSTSSTWRKIAIGLGAAMGGYILIVFIKKRSLILR